MELLLSALFAEAFSDRPGRQEVLNRLFEVVLIEQLRVTVGGVTPAQDSRGRWVILS